MDALPAQIDQFVPAANGTLTLAPENLPLQPHPANLIDLLMRADSGIGCQTIITIRTIAVVVQELKDLFGVCHRAPLSSAFIAPKCVESIAVLIVRCGNEDDNARNHLLNLIYAINHMRRNAKMLFRGVICR